MRQWTEHKQPELALKDERKVKSAWGQPSIEDWRDVPDEDED